MNKYSVGLKERIGYMCYVSDKFSLNTQNFKKKIITIN